jgi:hypothetical protein
VIQFLLMQDWAVGLAGGTRVDVTVPVGTQIDGTNPLWRGTPLPYADQVALDALRLGTPAPSSSDVSRSKAFDLGIDREALLTRAAEASR